VGVIPFIDARWVGEDGTVGPIEIVTGDLLIRSWQPEDADEVYDACQDPEIQRWTGVPSPYERHHATGFVTERAPADWAAGTAAPLGVFDRATGRLLGAHGLASTELVRHSAEIGYWTAPRARGRGVALAATRAVCTWAFAYFGLSRLTWVAEIGNHASRLVALRAGFRVVGETRLSEDEPGGRREAWFGTLLPGEVTATIPPEYAHGARTVRRASVFGGPVPTIPLDGPAGYLRGWREEDLDPVTGACQDPESAHWTTIPVPYHRSDAEWYLHDHVPAEWARGRAAIFVIADPDGRYVGSIDLRLPHPDATEAEIGFLVAPWARGLGYASAAARTICAWGFDALGLERIVWMAYLGNDASKRVAEKAGFTVEGVGRAACVQRGQRLDAWVGSLLSADPRPNPPAPTIHFGQVPWARTESD
jgi:RimJ/RimL family protein N-acetyltransferase